MKTQKFIFNLMLIVLAAVSLNACLTSMIANSILHAPDSITMDPDLPRDKAAVVIFGEEILVKEYNGIEVKSTWYPKDRTRIMTVTMPAGDAHLLFDIHGAWSRGNTTYRFTPKDMELKYNFEAGKEYTVGMYLGRNEGNFLIPRQKIYLAIWNRLYTDANPGYYGEENILKSWELGEF